MPASPQDDLLDRVISTPDICGGRPRLRGTRMRVSDVLDLLSAGATPDEIVADYDYLTGDDIRAALRYAALATGHRVVRAA